MERPRVCKPSIYAIERLLFGRHRAQTYKETEVNVTETLWADKMEDHLYILIFAISQTHRDRSTEQGEVQEKKYSIFCILKSHEGRQLIKIACFQGTWA